MDPLLFAEYDGRKYVLTSWLEAERINRVLPDAEILDYFAFGYKELVRGGRSYTDAEREAAVRAVKEIGIDEATVPGDLPAGARRPAARRGGHAQRRRRRRRAPAASEKRPRARRDQGGVRAAQSAFAAAAELLGRASVTGDGRLAVDGELLLAEHVRETLRTVCLEHGARCPPEAIVASVWSGVGHERGEGPLPAGLPIQIDLWPRHEESACWSDMTRTFVVGTPTPEHASLIDEQQRLVSAALPMLALRSARVSAGGRSTSGHAIYSNRRATRRSEPPTRRGRSRGFSSRSGTESGSRFTSRPCSASAGTSSSSPAT